MTKWVCAMVVMGAATAFAAPLDKKALDSGKAIVYEAYGQKFDAVAKKVAAKLGAAKKTTAAMHSWFALDGANCLELAVTKNGEGLAAVTIVSNPDDPKSGCH